MIKDQEARGAGATDAEPKKVHEAGGTARPAREMTRPEGLPGRSVGAERRWTLWGLEGVAEIKQGAKPT